MRTFYCYRTEVPAVMIGAETPEDAAIRAAACTEQGGRWIVTRTHTSDDEPAYQVEERRQYVLSDWQNSRSDVLPA